MNVFAAMKILLLVCLLFLVKISSATVLEVTSTANAGTGSLREAVETLANDGDTIIINVKGDILLQSPLHYTALNNVVTLGPSPSHCKIKAGGTFGGSGFVQVSNCSGLLFQQIGIVGTGTSNFRGVELLTCPGTITFESCLFEGFNVSAFGAAVYASGATATFMSCSFISNNAQNGAGLYGTSSVLELYNCTFWDNHAVNYGGGISAESGSSIKLVHNTFYQNDAGITGDAFYSSVLTNSVYVEGNAVSGNGVGPGQFGGIATYTSGSGNIFNKNVGSDTPPWSLIGSDLANTGLNMSFRSTILTDGFGLKYFPITSATSACVNVISSSLLIEDCRHAPRSLKSTSVSPPSADAGACEYTPLRVTLDTPGISPGTLEWAFASPQNFNAVNFVEFDINTGTGPYQINPSNTILLGGNYRVAGYSQPLSVVPGPPLDGTPGLTPANIQIRIDNNGALPYGLMVDTPSNQSFISGLRITGFASVGIYLFGSGTIIEGCEVGLDETGTSDANQLAGIYVSGNNNTIGNHALWSRNVISGNAPTLAPQANIHVNNGVSGTKILNNVIGLRPDGLNTITGPNAQYGINDLGINTSVGGIRAGNVLSGMNTGIVCNGCQGMVVKSNIIGMDYQGLVEKSNQYGVFLYGNGINATVGGSLPGEGNVISGNVSVQIRVDNFTNCSISGNMLGPDITGNVAPVTTTYGIYMASPLASAVTIGGTTPQHRNVISGNQTGMAILDCGPNLKILSNYVGLNSGGNSAIPNTSSGINIQNAVSSPVQIGQPGAGNVISGQSLGGNGITVASTSGTIISANIIGLDYTGTIAIPNQTGIYVNGASGVTIGGDISSSEGNVISGNNSNGITVVGGANNTLIRGNLIGTDINGTTAVGNAVSGITVNDANLTEIGGGANFRNVISGSSNMSSFGIWLSGTGTNTTISANYIGTDKFGTVAIPNYEGIRTESTHQSFIGGLSTKENYICASSTFGIHVYSPNTVIDGDFVGVGVSSALAGLGNSEGIVIEAPNVQVGMNTGSTNVISNNNSHGIHLLGDVADFCQIGGCYIGLLSSGSPAGNGGNGIYIQDGDNNTIGSFTNHIGANTGSGIDISGTAQQNIVKNNFSGNTGGIAGTNNDAGISINGGSHNTIGSVLVSEYNVFGGNNVAGIALNSADSNTISGNYVGINSSNASLPNDVGINLFNSDGNVIGKDWAGIGAPNYVANSVYQGTQVLGGSDNNIFSGNYYGTTVDGISPATNTAGIYVTSSVHNQFGGSLALGMGNVLAGNAEYGIAFEFADSNYVYGNRIGMNASNAPMGIQQYGIWIVEGNAHLIGGNRDDLANHISGNISAGIQLEVAEQNHIVGNIIGGLSGNPQLNGIVITDAAASLNVIGDYPLYQKGNFIYGNVQNGILIEDGASDNLIRCNVIGLDTMNVPSSFVIQANGINVATNSGVNVLGEDSPGYHNVITGNNLGILIDGATDQVVYNNRIGTDTSGMFAIGNYDNGIVITNGATNNVIGGASLKRNTISGNVSDGIVISGATTTANTITNNVIGLNISLTAALPNNNGIFLQGGTHDNFIGIEGSGNGNMISGNSFCGIFSDASHHNNIWNNQVGLGFGNMHGILLQNSSDDNLVGGTYARRNIISNNDSIGLVINSSTQNTITFNFLGTQADGKTGASNLVGVYLGNAASNDIGLANEGNVISGNTLVGIVLENGDANSVKGNLIGTDSTGNAALIGGAQNGIGIVVKYGINNEIGGNSNLHEGNVIANNSAQGIYLEATDGNLILGNQIGINKAGTAYLPNSLEGILGRLSATGNTIGSSATGESNAIAGNSAGIRFVSSNNNEIKANFIGNNLDGTGVLAGVNNQTVGIHIDTLSSFNLIKDGNVISGNQNYGIKISGQGTQHNQVLGNFIGVDAGGSTGLPNGLSNILLADSTKYNLVGSSLLTDRNIFGGDVPIHITLETYADSNQFSGNYINLGADGFTTYSATNGIHIDIYSDENIIGGGNAGEGNTIVSVSQDGIFLDGSDMTRILGNRIGIKPDNSPGDITGAGIKLFGADHSWIGSYLVGSDSMNLITNCGTGVVLATRPILNSSYANVIGGNSIYHNVGMGIDLKGDGLVEPIDTNNSNILLDNGGIDRPEIVSAWNCGVNGYTQVGFKFYCSNVLPNYHIEFYTNTDIDASGYGEGENYIGDFVFDPVTNYDTIAIDLGQTLPVGTVLTATITGVWGNTSEFSEQFVVTNPPVIGTPTTLDEICLGADNGTVNLIASEAYRFTSDGGLTWTYSDGMILDTLPTGSYTMDAEYLNGCIQSVGFVLNPGLPLPFNYNMVPDTCSLAVGEILIDTVITNSAGGTGFYLYSFNGGAIYTGQIDTLSLLDGVYSVALVDTLLGCYSDIQMITVSSIVDVVDEGFSFPDFCPGSTALPVSINTAGGTFTFETPPGDGALIDGPTGLISGAVTGNSYSVIYTVGQCFEKDTILVTAMPTDDPGFTMVDFCEGTSQSITITGLSGGTFSFDPDPLDGATIDPTTGELNGFGGTAYSVKYVTNGTCPDSSYVTVNVLVQPAAPQISATDSVYCPGEAIQTLSVPSTSAIVSWMLGSSAGTVVSSATDYTPTGLSEGDNYIYVTLTEGSCTSLPDSINYLVVNTSAMTAGEDVETCIGSQVQLNAGGALVYSWEQNDALTQTDTPDPLATITTPQEFVVTMADQYGCIRVDTVFVGLLPLEDCHVETYNAFSPNSDGKNDTWVIDGIEGYPENVVIIYNRWGDVLIRLENYNNSTVVWDGTSGNGNEVPAGTYFFVVEVGGDQNQSGWVQVVR